MAVRKAAEREGVLHPVSFRATTDLKEKLAKAASEAGRSLTQEIERRLERSFEFDRIVPDIESLFDEVQQLKHPANGAAPAGSAFVSATDLETIVERAVARALEQVLSPKGREPEQSQSATELPGRERSILELLMVGASNREIAQKLGIAPEALKAEMRTILAKINAANRTQAITWARQHLKAA
jgi:DNA-binding CsgD family transcriptional regulator